MTGRQHICVSKHRSSIPIKTSNRFSPLSDTPTEKPDESALVIGDSIVWNVKIETPVSIVQCLPVAKAPDILANLKVLANAKFLFSKSVIHVSAKDVRLHQSEITKKYVKEKCELASTMSDTVICSGPLPAYRGDDIHSRLSSLNGWMQVRSWGLWGPSAGCTSEPCLKLFNLYVHSIYLFVLFTQYVFSCL